MGDAERIAYCREFSRINEIYRRAEGEEINDESDNRHSCTNKKGRMCYSFKHN